jgi:hypothetical protein
MNHSSSDGREIFRFIFESAADPPSLGFGVASTAASTTFTDTFE